METKINETLDCKGLSCPMPMMKLAKTMKLEQGHLMKHLLKKGRKRWLRRVDKC